MQTSLSLWVAKRRESIRKRLCIVFPRACPSRNETGGTEGDGEGSLRYPLEKAKNRPRPKFCILHFAFCIGVAHATPPTLFVLKVYPETIVSLTKFL